MQFFEVIKEKSKLSRKEIAERLGITRQALEHYETGKGLSVANLMKLKELSGLSGNEFCNLLEAENWIERRKPKKKKRRARK